MQLNYSEPTKEQIVSYLEEKGFQTKEANGQIITNKCPFCKGDKIDWTHFYISPNGMYCCHKCSARGNLITLAKHFGDYKPQKFKSPDNLEELVKKPEQIKIKQPEILPEPDKEILTKINDSCEIYHKTLLEGAKKEPKTLDRQIFDYLTITRGIKIDAIKHFKLGWTGQSISIPYFEKEKVVNIRFRKNPFDKNDKIKKMYNTPGGKMILFNSNVIEKHKTLVITEGELDAISLYQEGWENVISVSCGANTFKKEWAETLKKQTKIYLCYDNDIVGVKGSEVAVEKLGAGRCYRIVLPKNNKEDKKDLNEYFIKDKKNIDDFHDLFNKAEKVTVEYEHIKHIKEFSEQTREAMKYSGKLRGLSTGYPLLDSVWSGMRKGDLIVISGDTNIGKTFFTQNIILNLARQGVSSLLFSLEQPVDEIIERFLLLDNQFSFQREKALDEKKAINKLDLALKGLETRPIYFYAGFEHLHPKLLGEVAEKAVKDFGCEILFIDHLHYFAGGDRQHRTTEIGDITSYIKLLARKLNIPIVLICHLRKLLQEGAVPTLDDLKDSSAIKQDADIVNLLYRKRDKQTRLLSQFVTSNVDKNRHGRLGKVDFIFGDSEDENSQEVPLCVFEESEFSDNEAQNAKNSQKEENTFKDVDKADLGV